MPRRWSQAQFHGNDWEDAAVKQKGNGVAPGVLLARVPIFRKVLRELPELNGVFRIHTESH